MLSVSVCAQCLMSNVSIWYQGSGRTTAVTISLALLITIIAIVIIDPFAVNITKSVITNSNIVSIWMLVIFRTIVAICSISTLVYLVSTVERDALLYHTNSEKFEPFVMKGFWRLSTFTCWSFICLSITFLVLALCSWMEILGIQIPHILLLFATLIYPVVYANSLLVTLVVTFILIPSNQKMGHPLENWFKFPEQIMHNANIIVLTIELILGNLPIGIQSIPLITLFGISYVIYAAFNERRTGIYFYSFLDPRLSKAAIIHIILLLVTLICFGIIFIVDAALKNWYVPTIIFLLISVPFILYVKEPQMENPQM